MNPLPMPAEVQTARLLLRRYSLGDLEEVLVYATDPAWARFLPVPVPYHRTHAEEFLAAQVQLDGVKHASWAIVHHGSVVGGINIRFQLENHLGELGYSIAPQLWNRGLATEAVRGVTVEAFRVRDSLNRLRAMADRRNAASQRVLVKSGFVQEGILRKNRVVRGEAIDEVWFGLLRSEL